ncbi:hypothetical protein ACH5RR_017431 [Cinchona calisaya]|uniref:Uncharacterized protein n=1 Tax=Cinchona calisaya TaxID=153742 RepID=A0ABD2ZIJ1_9GENT
MRNIAVDYSRSVCMAMGFASMLLLLFGNPTEVDGVGGNGGDDGGSSSTNRAGQPSCSKDNILVFQAQTAPLPNGIPTYTVQVQNVCASASCSISNIHLSCGAFSSARLVNPKIFRRLSINDCLVKDGQVLNPGQSLTFAYANTFSYPLAVSSVAVSCKS